MTTIRAVARAAMIGAWLSAAAAPASARPMESRQPPQAGTVRGVVVDHRTDTPLARVEVRLADTPFAVTTGGDGRFELAGVPSGEYTLTASVVGYALLRRAVSVAPGATLTFTLVLAPGTGTYEERVDVVAPVFESREPGTAAEQLLSAVEFQDLRGLVSDDPLRAVQALPGVTAGDDFSAEFAARGAGPRHTNVILDGVPAAAVLLHAVEGRDDTGSIARISSDALDRASLMLGSYPQRYGDRLGPQLEFTTREGSRDALHLRAVVSTIAAGGVAEGPIAGGRGSWLAVVRQSYLDWAIQRIDPDTTSWLGFTDGFAKAVLDLGPRHQLSASLLAGRAHYEEDAATGTNSLHDAFNRGGMATIGLRSTGPSWVLTQRVFALGNRFQNRRLDGQELGWGRRSDGGYRGEFSRVWSDRVTMDLGGHLQRTAEHQHLWVLDRRVPPRRTAEEDFGVAVTHAGVFGQVRWRPAAGATLTAGTRADTSGATGTVTASPWLQAEQRLGRGLALRAGGGLYHQVPAFDQIFGVHGGGESLVPQRAWHADAGVEQVLGTRTRWALTVFDREERGVAWASGLEPRSAAAPVRYNPAAFYENRLEGYARGVELVVQRRDPNGLSGWLAYAWARARYSDPVTGESFDGDYDQRHTFNAYVSLRLWSRSTVIARYRAGSNIPARGYYQDTGQVNPEGLPVFVAGPQRNAARLPEYARLDLRINHAFTFSTRRLTLFVELINVLNRTNVGSTGGRGVETLLPFVPAAGLLIEF
jgi:outer membrane cobalamin receptor